MIYRVALQKYRSGNVPDVSMSLMRPVISYILHRNSHVIYTALSDLWCVCELCSLRSLVCFDRAVGKAATCHPGLAFWLSLCRFISLLLSYHYVAPQYISWLRRETTTFVRLWAALLTLYIFRIVSHTATLWVVFTFFAADTDDGSHEMAGNRDVEESFFWNKSRLIHTWTPCQITIPFIGATLFQLSKHYNEPKVPIWFMTDVVTVLVVASCLFIPDLDNKYWSPLVTLSDIIVGPLMLLAVYMYQFDQNTLAWLYRSYSGFANLFDALIASSYILYLTHWPLMFIIEYSFGLTSTSTLTVLCIMFALFWRLFCVMPFRDYIGRLKR